jgi:hypothetical protein
MLSRLLLEHPTNRAAHSAKTPGFQSDGKRGPVLEAVRTGRPKGLGGE